MTTLGSVSREEAAERFPFLAARYPGRRVAIKGFTHAAPDFVTTAASCEGASPPQTAISTAPSPTWKRAVRAARRKRDR